jgi:hypothetical protein
MAGHDGPASPGLTSSGLAAWPEWPGWLIDLRRYARAGCDGSVWPVNAATQARVTAPLPGNRSSRVAGRGAEKVEDPAALRGRFRAGDAPGEGGQGSDAAHDKVHSPWTAGLRLSCRPPKVDHRFRSRRPGPVQRPSIGRGPLRRRSRSPMSGTCAPGGISTNCSCACRCSAVSIDASSRHSRRVVSSRTPATTRASVVTPASSTSRSRATTAPACPGKLGPPADNQPAAINSLQDSCRTGEVGRVLDSGRRCRSRPQ